MDKAVSNTEKALKVLKKASCQDDIIWLVVGLTKPVYRPSIKPHPIEIPFSFIDVNKLNVCILVKDEPAELYKKALKSIGIKCITKIITISKLKKKYSTFESKRTLCSAFDVFLADESITGLLPKLIGKSFYVSKRLPLPVDLSLIQQNRNLDEMIPNVTKKILKALNSTYLCLNNGPCISIKIGITSQTDSDICANAEAVFRSFEKLLPNGGFDNVRSLHLKTKSSPSVPVLASTLNEE